MAHITSSPASLVSCHSPPFSPLIDQFCGNQALWLVKAAMIPVLWLAVTRTDCYLVTGSPGQTRCHGRATREQQLGENIFLSKPLWCILQNASKWILFFSKIILNVSLSFKFIIERATPGKYLVNQNSMSCSKCLFCNLKARSISNPRLSWTFTSQSWLVREERKVTLWLGLGSEQRCNFTNYPPIDLVSYLLPTGPQSATSSREPESWRQAMSGAKWMLLSFVYCCLRPIESYYLHQFERPALDIKRCLTWLSYSLASSLGPHWEELLLI